MRVPLFGYLLLTGISLFLLRSIDLEDETLVVDDSDLKLDFYEVQDSKSFAKKTLHFVPHSHTDVGWLLTMGEYNKMSVDQMLTTAVDYLKKVRENPSSSLFNRFTFDSVAFLREWVMRHPDKLDDLRALVKDGYLQILNGGISQHDQGCVYIDHLIFNYEYGRGYTKKHLGLIPIVGWSIDPFGVSVGSAKAFKEMGFEFLGLNRVPFEFKEELRYEQDLLFNWKLNETDPNNDLLTYVVPIHYGTPGPFNFHSKIPVHYGANPPEETILSAEFKLLTHLCIFMDDIFDQAKLFKEENVLVLLGDDFAYSDFGTEADAFTEIIIAFGSNNITGVFAGSTMLVSTTEQYLNAIKSDKHNRTRYEFNEGFPLTMYDTSEGEYGWTGYFTTNPFLKLQIKQLLDLYRGTINHAAGLALIQPTYLSQLNRSIPDLEPIKFLIGILSHHDAITGTCTRHVVKDYLRMVKTTQTKLESYLGKLFNPVHTNLKLSLDSSVTLKQTSGEFTVINPSLSQSSSDMIRVRFEQHVSPALALLRKSSNSNLQLAYELCDVIAGCEHAFRLDKPIDRLGTETFSYSTLSTKSHNYTTQRLSTYETMKFKIEIVPYTSGYSMAAGQTYNSSGLLITHQQSDVPFSIVLAVGRHEGFIVEKLKKKSGAYVFTTIDGRDMAPFELKQLEITDYPTTVVITAQLRHRPKAVLHVILDKQEPHKIRTKIHMETLYFDEEADYVVRYELANTPKTHRPFVVDSSGFDFAEHTFKEHKRLELSYYPISKFIQLEEPGQNVKLTVFADRAQGGTSPRAGSLEIAVNRVNYGEDNLGLIQRVHDTYHLRTEHVLVIEPSKGVKFRAEQVKLDSQLIYLMSNTSEKIQLPQIDLPKVPSDLSERLKFTRIHAEQKSETTFCFRVFNFSPTETLTFTSTAPLSKMVQELFKLGKTPVLEARSLDFTIGLEEYRSLPYKWTENKQYTPAWLESPTGAYSIPPNTIRTFLMSI